MIDASQTLQMYLHLALEGPGANGFFRPLGIISLVWSVNKKLFLIIYLQIIINITILKLNTVGDGQFNTLYSFQKLAILMFLLGTEYV